MTHERIEIPIACQRLDGVFTPEAEQRHGEIWARMEKELSRIEEMDSGYAFVYPLDDALFREIAEFVTYERLCCPFFAFGLELDPAKEYIRLSLSGGEGVKEFLTIELVDPGQTR